MTRRPSPREIEEEDHRMLRRREHFRVAAERVAAAFAGLAAVQKVTLFGSVAAALGREAPRFREFRRWDIEILHECKDVDLLVWLEDLGCLRELQRARSRALRELLAERNIGVAHHQVDVFVMSALHDSYLGRLCWFKECPKGKAECETDGCGQTPLLKEHDDFIFSVEALQPERSIVLFERGNRDASCASEWPRDGGGVG